MDRAPLAHQLGLELLELASLVADQLELVADVPERLLEDALDLGRILSFANLPAELGAREKVGALATA